MKVYRLYADHDGEGELTVSIYASESQATEEMDSLNAGSSRPYQFYFIEEHDVIPDRNILPTINPNAPRIHTPPADGSRASLLSYLDFALCELDRAKETTPSRQLSLAITNLEQSIHWMENVEVDGEG